MREENDLTQCKCGDCIHFIGCGDFGLCCDIKYDLCYEETDACDKFDTHYRNKNSVTKNTKRDG